MEGKRNFWSDLLFIAIGVITLVLLFMPEPYKEWRMAGYIGVGIFLAYLIIREVRRKRSKQGGEEGQNTEDKG